VEKLTQIDYFIWIRIVCET